MSMESVILKVKRSNSPFYRLAKKAWRSTQTASLPVPGFLRKTGRTVYHLHGIARTLLFRIVSALYREPVFRCRCEASGRRLTLVFLPDAFDHTQIFIGDDVVFHGKTGIYSGRVFDEPRLIIGNRVSIGHQVDISCNQEIVIEDDVLIAGFCRISDNDGHPVDAVQRTAGFPAPAESTRPVRICRMAWIGSGAVILKGVTIGEGAIVAAGSIVTTSVAPYTIVGGNPAKAIRTIERQDGRC